MLYEQCGVFRCSMKCRCVKLKVDDERRYMSVAVSNLERNVVIRCNTPFFLRLIFDRPPARPPPPLYFPVVCCLPSICSLASLD